MPEIPHAAEVQVTEEAQTEALKALKEDLDIANTRIRDLEQERDDLTSQLVSSKQKQLNLINEVGGIKEARPEAEDYQALKTAKDALEKKFVEEIEKQKAKENQNLQYIQDLEKELADFLARIQNLEDQNRKKSSAHLVLVFIPNGCKESKHMH